MKRLEKIILVQFYLNEAVELSLSGNTAFLGPNGSGKTSLLDAIQIAMLGAHGNYLAFNSQTTATGRRSIRDYCLGVYRDGSGDSTASDRKRDTALTYITLVFRDRDSNEVVSAGVCLEAMAQEPDHQVNGLYVLPGVDLSLSDHVERDDEGMLPLKWSDFRQRAVRLSAIQGRTPSIQARAETYVGELLFQLQPKARHINPKDFLKIFRKSVHLRHIEHVDQFVREYLIDEQRIDKKRAMAQIEEFRRLKQLVEQVEQQLIKLSALTTRYRRLHTEYRKAATAEALAAIYQVEHVGACIGDLEDQLEKSRTEWTESVPKKEALERQLQALRAESESLLRSLTSHPTASAFHLFEQYRAELQSSEAQTIRTLLSFVSRYSQLFAGLRQRPELSLHEPVFKDLHRRLLRAKDALEQGDIDGVSETLVSAGRLTDHVRDACARALDSARRDLEAKERELSTARSSFENARQGGARIGRPAAYALSCLAQVGIAATPICNLLSVKDRRWQPAIEALLGGAREALVIEPGRERDAVRAIRQLPSDARPYGVTFIQPTHLRDEKWVDTQDVLVGSLMESTNATALDYVRQVLGKTRCVQTEEELERYPRALTMDGMLSSRGGTRALRLVPAQELQLGVGREASVLQQAKEEWQNAATEYSQAQTVYHRLKDMDAEQTGLAALIAQHDPAKAIETLIAKRVQLIREAPVLTDEDRGAIEAMKADRDAKEKAIQIATTDLSQLTERVGALGNSIQTLIRQLESERLVAQEQARRESHLRQHQDFDPDMLEPLRTEIDAAVSEVDYNQRLRLCSDKSQAARDLAETLSSSTKDVFIQYLTEYSVSLLEERSDWRKAFAWVQEEHQRLNESELVNYREQTERARQSAEESFRKDIVIRLRECIQKMRVNIDVLNSTLKSCPPFSNGEQYEFRADPAATYKRLFDYIMASTESSSAGLLENDLALQKEVLQLLDTESDSGSTKTPNPLDDYRLLFSFDIRILQEGSVIGTLSGRTGKASNGEHRTPFYVTAGAALAAAYRIKAGEEVTGAALMILDEAFSGMDPQNALATAEFLSSLGLQLVMAAPDSDYGKLAAVCGTLVEVSRFGPNVFLDTTELKPAARTLLMTDLPSKHPELLEETVRSLH